MIRETCPRLQLEQLLDDRCGVLVGHKIKDFRKNDRTDIDEKSSILDMLVYAFDFNLDTILNTFPRYVEGIERLYLHH